MNWWPVKRRAAGEPELTIEFRFKEDAVTPEEMDERNLRQDYRRKSVRIPPPKPVRDVLSQLLAKRGYAQVQQAAASTAAWREAVGEKFSVDTRPGNVRRGVLEVLVRNSAVMHELAFVKAKVLKSLAKIAPEQGIKDLRLRVGTID